MKSGPFPVKIETNGTNGVIRVEAPTPVQALDLYRKVADVDGEVERSVADCKAKLSSHRRRISGLLDVIDDLESKLASAEKSAEKSREQAQKDLQIVGWERDAQRRRAEAAEAELCQTKKHLDAEGGRPRSIPGLS